MRSSHVSPAFPRFLVGAILLIAVGWTATNAVAQTPYTWTGTAADNSLNTGTNWNPNVSSFADGDTMQWNGSQSGNLSLLLNSGITGTSGGVNIVETSAQTGSLSIDSSSFSMRVENITLASGAGALTLGSTSATNAFTFTFGGSGFTSNTLTNNSSNTATFSTDIKFADGGAVANRLVDFAGSGNWTINSVFGVTSGIGTLQIQKDGAGTLTLANTANTYTGPTTINAGVVSISADGCLGANPGSFTANQLTLNGGTLKATGTFTTAANRGVTIGSSGGTFDVTGVGFNIASAGLAGAGTLTTGGAGGAFTLSGANSGFTGKIVINSGNFGIDGDAALGAVPGSFLADAITLNGGILMNMTNATTATSYGAGWDFTLNANRGITLGASGGTIREGYTNHTVTINGVISGAGAFNVAADGNNSDKLVLAGANTFTGNTTNLSAATTLILKNSSALQDSTLASGGLGFAFDSSVATHAFTFAGLSSGNNLALQDNATPTANAVTLTVGNNNASSTYTGVLSGGGSLIQNGSGTFTLSGAATFTGSTTIQNGTIKVGVANALPTARTVTFGGTTTSGVLDLNALSQQVGGVALASGASWTGQTITNNTTGTGTLVFNSAGSSTFGGVIQDGGGGKSTALTVSAGTLTLSGANTFSGAINLNGGILSVASIADTSGTSNIGLSASQSVTLNGGDFQYTGSGAATTARSFGANNLATDTIEVTNASGALTLTGGFGGNANGPNQVIKQGPGTLTLAGTADNGGLGVDVKAGTLILGKTSGANHAVGANQGVNALIIDAGLVQLSGSAGDQIYTNSSVKLNGGTFDFNGQSEGWDELTGNAGTILNNVGSTTSTITLGQDNGSSTFGGVLTNGNGTLALAKIGTGTFVLSGANTATGGLLLQNGVLQVGGASGAVASQTLTFGLTATANVGTFVLGDGSNAKSVTLSNINEAGTGTTNVIKAGGASGMSALIVNSTTFGNYLGTIGGAGTNENNLSLALQGGGVLTLDDSGGTGNTFVGKTTVSGGSILGIRVGNELGSPASLVADAVTLNGGVLMNMTNATSLTAYGSGWSPTLGANVGITLGAAGGTLRAGYGGKLFTINGPVAGVGALTVMDGSTVVLDGVNTYTGNTIITASGGNNGNLQIGGAGQLGSGSYAGTISIIAGGSFNDNSSANQTLSGAISGGGTFAQSGAGTLILTGANTYTGATTVSAGKLQIGAGGTTGTLGTAAVTDNAALVFQRSDTISVANVISGSGSLTQNGPGVLTLTAGNSYTGGTTIANGTLQIGANNTLATGGSIAFGDATHSGTLDLNALSQQVAGLSLASGASWTGQTITNNATGTGTLVYGGAGTSTFGGVIQDGGTGKFAALTVSAGTLILSGANTNTGTTTLNGGTLRLSGGSNRLSTAGSVAIAGGTFDLNGQNQQVAMLSGATGTLTNSAATDATLTIQIGANSAGTFAGAITSPSTGKLNLVFNSTGTSSTASNFALNNTTGNTFTGSITVNGNGFTDGADNHGGILGINTDASLGNTANSITLNNGGALADLLNPASGGGWSNGGAFTLAATRTLTMGSGVGGVIRIGFGNTCTINSLINGTGGLTHVDGGNLILTNANTFSGDTTNIAGTLQLSNSLALQNSSLATAGITFDPAVSSHAFTLGGLKNNFNLSLNDGTNAVALSVGNNNANTTYSGILSNSGSLTKIGSGTLTMTGGNSYTGGTSVNNGTLQFGDGTSANGTLPGNASIASGATLAFDYTGAVTYNGVLSGPTGGTLSKIGAGTVSLTAASSSFNGAVTVSSGILSVGVYTTAGASGGTNTSLGNGPVSVAAGAQLVFSTTGLNIANNVTLNGLTTNGALIGGIATGTQANTLSGSLTLAATSNLTTYWSDKTLTITGQVTGAGGLTIDSCTGGPNNGGSNIVLSNNANNYNGNTTVDAGTAGSANPTLRAGAANVIPSGASTGNVVVNGIFDLNTFSQSINGLSGSGTIDTVAGGAPVLTVGNNDATSIFTGVIKNTSGTLGLTKTGVGTLTLAATNTYSGATQVNGGTLRISGAIASGGAIAVANGATLTGNGIAGNVTVASGGIVAGAPLGSGTLTLTSLTYSSDGMLNVANAANYPSTSGAAAVNVGSVNQLSLGGTVTVNVSGTPPTTTGFYHLLQYAGSQQGAGAFTLGATPASARNLYSLANDSGYLDLQVTADSIIWTGATDNTWSGTNNWKLNSSGAPTSFLPNDVVAFNGSEAAVSTTVTISGADVNPALVTFSGAKNYTIAGTNAITGTGALALAGSGAVTINNANTFTGGLTLSSGQLNIGNSAALGAAANVLTITGGTIDNTSGAALALTNNNPMNWNGDFAFAGAGDGSHDLNLGTGAVTLNATRSVTVGAGQLQVGGIISSAPTTTAGLIKSGAGTLVLSGANNYVGNTTVSAGTLVLSGANSFTGNMIVNGGILSVSAIADSGTSNIGTSATSSVTINGGDFQYTGTGAATTARPFNASNAATDTIEITSPTGQLTLSGSFPGNANGPNQVIKQGPGTLTLAGTADNGGLGVDVKAGTLILGKTSANHSVGANPGFNALTIDAGLVQLSGNAGDQIYANSAVQINGGTFDFNGQSEGWDQLNGAGGTVLNNVAATTSTITLGQDNGSSTYGGVLANGNGTLVLAKTGTGTLVLTGANTATGGLLLQNGVLQVGGASGAVGAQTLTFGLAAAANVGTFVLGDATNSKTITLSNLNEAATATGTTNVIKAGGASGMSALIINSTTFGNFFGTIGGAGTNENNLSLALQGGGVLTLDDSGGTGSTFAGKTTVSGGSILGIRVGNELGAPASLVPDAVTLNGGVLMNMTSATSLTAYGSGWSPTLGANVGINLGAAGGTLRAGYAGKLFTINGPITGSGALTVVDGSTVVLDGVNTYTGNTIIAAVGTNNGNLQIGGAGQLGSGSYAGNISIIAGGSFNDNSSAGQTLSGAISGGGTFAQSGAGTLILTGANTYNGATTISGGVLQIGAGGAAGTLGTGAVTDNAALAFQRSDAISVANTISGTGSVSQNGSGVLTLTGFNGYGGGTNVNSGTLVAANINVGSGPIAITGGGTLRVLTKATASHVANFGGNGAGWTLNGGATVTGDVLQVTDNAVNEARSAFLSTPQPLTYGTAGFTASFVYTPSGAKAADGAAFILQSDSRGASALGGTGGALGYGALGANAAISPSAALEINLYNGHVVGSNFVTNGAQGTYLSTSPLDVTSGDPIQVTLAYDPVALTVTETLTDSVASTSYMHTFTGMNLGTILGSNFAYVGFSGGTGGATSTQQFSGFTYDVSAGSNVYANSVTLPAAANATIDVGATASVPTISMGALNVVSGGGATLNLTATTAPTNSAYSLSLGAVSLGSNLTLNVANNGSGTGTLNLGALNDGGTARTLTMSGPGTVILTAPSVSLVAGTVVNVSAGTLNAGAAAALGVNAQLSVGSTATFTTGANQTISSLGGAGSVVVGSGATLTVGSSDNLSSPSFTGTISGAGALATGGTGTLALSTANSYSGGTTVGSGTLRTTNASGSATGTGPVTLNGATSMNSATLASGSAGTISGAVTSTGFDNIAPGGVGSVGTLNLGSTLTVNGNSTLRFDASGSTSDLLNITNGGVLAVPTGLPTITFDSAASLVNGHTYTLATFAASTDAGSNPLSNADFNITNVPTGFTIDVTSTNILLVTSNTNAEWNVNASGNYSAVNTNWNPNTLPSGQGLIAKFGNGASNQITNPPTTAITVTVDGAYTVGSLQFSNTQGTQYTLNSDLVNQPTYGITLDNNNHPGVGATISVATGVAAGIAQPTISTNLTFNDNVTFNVASGSALIITSGKIVETGGPRNLTLTGGGTLTLDSTPVNYTGATTVHGGTLRTTATSNIGSNSATDGSVTLDASGGANSALRIGNVQTVSSLNTVTPPGSGTTSLRVDSLGALTVGGTSSFTGAINLQPNSQLNVAANSSLVINAVSSPAPSVGASVTATVNSGATLELDGMTSALADPSALSSGSDTNPTQRGAVTNDGTLIAGDLATTDAATQQIGGIDGGGSVTVADHASLTADHINQSSLVIGNGSVFTLAPSDSSGNPMASLGTGGSLVLAGSLAPPSSFVESSGSLLGAVGATGSTPTLSFVGASGAIVSAVPEPASGLLFGLGALGLLSLGAARRKKSAR